MTWKPLIAVLVTLLAAVLLAPPALARPQDGHLVGSGHMVALPRTGTDWYGAYHVDQRTAYCADLMAHGPSRATGWTEAPVGSPLPKQRSAAPGTHGRGPNAASERELAEISWALTTTGTQPAPDLGAAVEHFVRLRTIDGEAQVARERERWAAVVKAHPAALTHFDALTRDAARFAGPYRVEFNWQRRASRTNPTGHVIVAVRAHSGAEVPNVAILAGGSGALRVTDAPTSTGVGGAAHIRLDLPEPQEKEVSGALSVQVRGLPSTHPRIFIPQPATVQRLLAAPDVTNLSASTTVELTPQMFHPTVTTRTRDVIAEAGAPAIDIVTLSGGRPGADFSGATTLHGPFGSLAELTASDPKKDVVGVAEFAGSYDAKGNAEVHSTELEFPEPGYYTWVESLDARPTVVPPAEPSWPQLSETSVVLSPEVETVLTADGQPHTAEVGAELSDSLRLRGVPASREVPGSSHPLSVYVSGRIVGPVSPGSTSAGPSCEAATWKDAPVLSSYAGVAWEGEDLTGLAPVIATEPGCYSADALVEIKHEGRLVSTTHHAVGIPSQTVLVTAPPVAEPEPDPTPEPTPEREPTPEPEPTPAPKPPSEPKPKPEPEQTPKPTPTATPPMKEEPKRPRPGPPKTGR